MHKKIFFSNSNSVYSDRSELYISDEIIRIQNFLFSRKLWWQNCWKLPKLHVTEKPIVFKLSKISIPNFDSTNWRFKWRLRQNFTSLYFMVWKHCAFWQRSNFGNFQQFFHHNFRLKWKIWILMVSSERFSSDLSEYTLFLIKKHIFWYIKKVCFSSKYFQSLAIL